MSPTLPPQVIAHYQQSVPDAGERFFRYMEREQEHRHGNQRTVLGHISRAQMFTFLLGAFAMVGGFTCVMLGYAAGLAVAAAGVLPVLQAVYSRHKQDKIEQKQQQDQLPSGPAA